MKKKGLIITFICLVFSMGATAGLVTLQSDVSRKAVIRSPLAADVSSPISDGKSLLQAKNILAARDKFAQAVAADPGNQEANLLYGVTRVLAVVEDGQSLNTGGLDSVREILELAGASIQSFNIYGSDMTLPKKFADATPRTGIVLDFLKTKLMPEIDGAIENLAMVTNTSFTSVLPSAGLGRTGVDIIADYADAMVIKALFNAVKCNLNLLMVYGLDASLPDIQANPKQWLTYKQLFHDANFLAVKDASSLATAKSALIDFIDGYNASVPFLLARTGGAHHLFVVDLPVITNEPFPTSSEQLIKIKGILSEIKLALAGQHTFIGNAPLQNRTINLSKFFDAANPIDIRAKLADHNTNTILPDPTFDGHFPQGLTGYEKFVATYKNEILGVIFTTGGDINGDGEVTIGDALMSLRVAVGLVPMDNKYLPDADVAPLVNGKPAPDGQINIGDALLILRKSVGLITW